jgi:indole-3-glycerol phosphate synthase
MNTLERICADKKDHIRVRMEAISFSWLDSEAKISPAPRGFLKSLRSKAAQNKPALIAEIKKASPSGGVIRPDFDPAQLARIYEDSGAACLSVLTDIPWFQGKDEDLLSARAACTLPVLRKDFMVDPYQVAEARALGADCILLIMAALDDGLAAELHDAATGYGMDVLIEVHDAGELDRALRLPTMMIGVNSRNLKTLEVRLETAMDLAARIPKSVFRIAESGIRTSQDVRMLQGAGYEGFLVGESLMRQDDVGKAVRDLLG